MTLEVGRGEVLCMVGPSGSGKSTFLRCINHLEQVNAGRLYVDGDLIGYRDRGTSCYEMPPRDAAKQRRDIGMVFQHFNLFPHRTALENIIEAPIHVKGVKKATLWRGQRICWIRWAWRKRPPPIRRSCPAASSSVWRSPARWR